MFFLFLGVNPVLYCETQKDFDAGIHVFTAERVYENPTGRFPHKGVGKLVFYLNIKHIDYSELSFGEEASKFDISQEIYRLTRVQKISREHYVFEGVDSVSGAKSTGFIKKENSKWDFEILGYYVNEGLAYKIQPVHSEWAKKIIEKFPDIDFGQ